VHKEERKSFRIVEENDRLRVESSEPGGGWKREYSFTLTPRRLEDFAGMCHYHQTSPESHFTQKGICTLATSDGRVTLADYKLIITRNGNREERLLASDAEWRESLQQHFEVVL
jgi:N-hydroxyarylamine O-acetyltransferase